jgi:PiT family inorganic phosphate transporter
MTWLVLGLVLALAFWNGANDNFKGVATIYGSGSASYRRALAWATATTFAGSLLSFVLAAGLIKTFSGTGLVPKHIAASPSFLAAVALAAALTVLVATRLGLPVSTTHALTGALVGAGLVAAGRAVDLSKLEKSFLLPLALSPLAAIALTAALYPLASSLRRAAGLTSETCVCVGEQWVPLALAPAGSVAITRQLSLSAGTTERCQVRYQGNLVGVSAQAALDVAHFASAGAVSFARGLNDTPKMVALILAAKAVGSGVGIPLLGIAIAVGGVLGARRVAETMSHRVTTELSPGQGLIANLVSAGLVVAATRYSLPVSTTHVTNGGLFGIGAVKRKARWRTIGTIVLAWLTTLPLGAALGAVAYLAL